MSTDRLIFEVGVGLGFGVLLAGAVRAVEGAMQSLGLLPVYSLALACDIP